VKKIIAFGLLLSMLLGSVVLWAAVKPPQEVIQDTSARMLNALRQNRETLRQDSSRIYALVDQIVLPNFDFELMSRWVLGRNWQQATPEQRRRFADEFRTLLVRTYAKALLEYADNEIRILPSANPADHNEATVKTEVQVRTGSPIPINYTMHLNRDGWKVYDVTVDGVSLVTNYRDTFKQEVSSNGINGLIVMLANRNKQLESGKK
jgi:phospholipid transport system substrate-binding protein